MPDPQNPPRVEEPQAAYDPAAASVRASRRLEQSGFSRPQSEAVVLAVRELAGDLATKEDLVHLEKDLATAKSELRAEISGAKNELRAEMAELKSELRAEIAATKGELKAEIAHSETRLNKAAFRNAMWIVGVTVGTIVAAIGIATAIATTLILSALQP